MDQYQKLRLVDGLQTITLKKDELVFNQGDECQEFYIIQEGEVDCLKVVEKGNKRGYVHVRTLEKGSHFGELALINNDKRSLSIRVKSDSCILLRLDRETFSRILGSIEKHLKKDYDKQFDKKFEEMQQNKKSFSGYFNPKDFE